LVGDVERKDDAGDLGDIEQAERLGLSQFVGEQEVVDALGKQQAQKDNYPNNDPGNKTPATAVAEFVGDYGVDRAGND
jgi:hypothetical protein